MTVGPMNIAFINIELAIIIGLLTVIALMLRDRRK